jgi:hypothetical protein
MCSQKVSVDSLDTPFEYYVELEASKFHALIVDNMFEDHNALAHHPSSCNHASALGHQLASFHGTVETVH